MDTQLCAALEAKLAQCRRDYDDHKDDAFDSTLMAAKLQQLQDLYDQLKGGQPERLLLAQLQELLPRLEQEKEHEAEYPTFDWYDEHHYYKVYAGRWEACREVLGLLQGRGA